MPTDNTTPGSNSTLNPKTQNTGFDFNIDLPETFPTQNTENITTQSSLETPISSLEENFSTPQNEPTSFLQEDTIPESPAPEVTQNQTTIENTLTEDSQIDSQPPQTDNIQSENTSSLFAVSEENFPVSETQNNTASEDLPQQEVDQETFSTTETAPELDPFEAMKASLTPSTSPEELPTVNNNLEITSTSPLPQNSTEIQEETKADLIQQDFTIQDQFTSDLPQYSPTQQETPTPQMLSLDEMIAQPSTPPQTPNTFNLDSMSIPNTLTETNPFLEQAKPVASASSHQSAKIITGVIGVGILSVVGLMWYMRYPDLINNLLNGTSQQNTNITPGVSPDIQEHGAAPLTWENTTSENTTLTWSEENIESPVLETGTTESTEEIMIDESLISTGEDSIQETVLELETWDDTLPISSENLQTGENTEGETQVLPTAEKQEAVDALSAVEDIVGTVSPKDALNKTIEEYRLQAQTIADNGKAKGDRNALKRGIFVARKVQALQEELANGREMNISEWNTLKAEYDLSLAKATQW